MLKGPLALLCSLTLLAVAYLTLTVMILRPPRANLAVWLPLAALLVAQSALTLAAVRPHAPLWLRLLVAAGGVGLTAVGLWMAARTLTSAHFEGYALILGAMLGLQGVLTVAAFLRVQDFRRALSG